MARLAVLIDADNTSHQTANAIFEEIASFGEASVRRIYGDFSSPQMKGWSEKQAGLGIVPHHQPANTVGKNASDIALVIDAMDLLLSGRFDGFVLVSSDSDFTRLSQRIREQGVDVYGIGRRKTPEAFRMACKRFIFVENLISGGGDAETEVKPKKEPLNKAAQLILNVLEDASAEDGWARLSAVGSQLGKRYPDFDTRSYGYGNLSGLIREAKGLELVDEGAFLKVRKKGKA